MKYHIEKNTVQETLVIPLYGRKMCSELYPNLYRDETALRLIDQIDYDFSLLSQKSKSLMQQFGFLEAAMRQNDLAWEVRDYLRTHPHASAGRGRQSRLRARRYRPPLRQRQLPHLQSGPARRHRRARCPAARRRAGGEYPLRPE